MVKFWLVLRPLKGSGLSDIVVPIVTENHFDLRRAVAVCSGIKVAQARGVKELLRWNLDAPNEQHRCNNCNTSASAYIVCKVCELEYCGSSACKYSHERSHKVYAA